MSGSTAKELRKLANFKISHDPEIKKSPEYIAAKSAYRSFKKAYAG